MTKTREESAGYTLVELLVTISVIGVMSAIAIASISNVTGKTKTATAKSNASLLVSTAGQALMAGSPAMIAATSEEGAVDLVLAGITGGEGFEQIKFKINLTEKEVARASKYMEFEDNRLVYTGGN
jgi:prepilin-type N-terminal cleavage/methylation domain-containing protein